MLVRNCMSTKVVTLEPDRSIADARALLERYRIRHLVVTHKERLVGVVSDRDLRGAPKRSKTVSDLMSRKPIVVAPQASIDEAARLLRKYTIGSLPVVEGNKLVGILTAADVIDAFVDLSGVGEATVRMTVAGVKGRQAQERVRQILQHVRAELKWMHPDTRDATRIHLRLKARAVDDVVTALEAAGFEVESVVAPTRGSP